MKGELPTIEELEKGIPIEGNVLEVEVEDIDTKTLENAINNNVSLNDIKE